MALSKSFYVSVATLPQAAFVRIASLGISTQLYNAWPQPRRQCCTAWLDSGPGCALSDARFWFDSGVFATVPIQPRASST